MHRWQALVAIAACAGLAVGLAGGALWRGDAPNPPDADAPDRAVASADRALRAELDSLRDALAAEREARAALESEVAGLREELQRTALPTPEVETPKDATAAAEAPTADPHGSIGVFDDARLAEAGVPAREVERLRERYDESRMEELYLDDQAAREGWLRTPRHYAEVQDLRQALREELGDDDYDRLLYAVGKNNRVVVTDVLGDSPAMEAGFASGDVLLRYDGRRIFNVLELKQATTEGRAGDTVPVEVQRGSERLRFYLPRGPLGVTLRPAVYPPEPPR
jgi:hypothetical protein